MTERIVLIIYSSKNSLELFRCAAPAAAVCISYIHHGPEQAWLSANILSARTPLRKDFQRLYKLKMKEDDKKSFVSYDIKAPAENKIFHSLAEARLFRKLTQKDLSEKTGIAQTEISKIEKGIRNPSLALLRRLADGMDMILTISFIPDNRTSSGDCPENGDRKDS